MAREEHGGQAVDLTTYGKLAQAAQQTAAALAIVVAGVWAIFKFRVRAEHSSALSVTTTAEALPCHLESEILLTIRCVLTNVGKRPCVIDLQASRLGLFHVKVDDERGFLPLHGRPLESADWTSISGIVRINVPPGVAYPLTATILVRKFEVYYAEVGFALTARESASVFRRMGATSPRPPRALWTDRIVIWGGVRRPLG